MRATIELSDLILETRIGTYGPDDVVPSHHSLDLTLSIDPSLVLIDNDGMEAIFDYDPLIKQIDALARDGHYETQERLMTRIVDACAAHAPVQAVMLFLRRTPVLGTSGALGVRLSLNEDEFRQLR